MVAAKSRLPCNGKPSSYELMKTENAKEASLRTLMIAGLNGDAAAYRALLSGLSGHLRAYYRGKLVRAGRGTEETEDLVQEALMAVHMRRHTYDPTQLLTPWVYAIARYKLIDHLRTEPVNIDECTDRGCLGDHSGGRRARDGKQLGSEQASGDAAG